MTARLVLALGLLICCGAEPRQDGLAALIAELPDPGYPVELVRVRGMADWADSIWDDERETFVVRVRAGIPHEFAVDSLVHEWGHLLVWDACQESPHDDLWAVAYGRCYRKVIEE